MATLTNQTVASTYPLLLKMQTSSLHATDLGIVEDGDGSPAGSALRISGAAVNSSGTLTSTGDFDVNTDKFTVAAATGNSIIAGTLGVTGVITATGGVTGNVTGDITGAVTATSGSLATSVTAVTQTANNNSTKVATTAYVDAAVPSGCIMQFCAAAAPTGWLICDGDATLNTYTYRILHAVISNTYGGDAYDAGVTDQSGATTVFTLPDFKGRVAAGVDNSAGRMTANNTIADTGGVETHAITPDEMPAHKHPNNTRYESSNSMVDYSLSLAVSSGQSVDHVYSVTAQGSYTANAGGGTAHTNLQPYLVVNYIIKT